ncbi:MAG: 50S ribosomal protein L24e [Candidatus Micrarchaeota archaeon]|nr:MAG: 50S ribosomal protein L24e [Candidatus Micrarchaeota archaeon]
MKCNFCNTDIRKGTGLMYVARNGKTFVYCSSRCYKYDRVYKRKINKKLLNERSK